MSAALRLEGVTYRYPGTNVDALRGVTLEVGASDFVGVVGPNGGGKTTLLKLLLGMLTPRAGRIEVLGRTPSRARASIGYVPQHATVDATVPANVLDIVLLGRLSGSSWGPWYSRRDREAALLALERTQTEDLERRTWSTLSGGQRQRVLIARALVSEAKLLLLDEPTAGVDTHREHELLVLLHRLNEELPILMVSHDLALVASHMNRAVWVNRGIQAMLASELTVKAVERLLHEGEPAVDRAGTEALVESAR